MIVFAEIVKNRKKNSGNMLFAIYFSAFKLWFTLEALGISAGSETSDSFCFVCKAFSITGLVVQICQHYPHHSFVYTSVFH